jgi:hypothetical protein
LAVGDGKFVSAVKILTAIAVIRCYGRSAASTGFCAVFRPISPGLTGRWKPV